MSTIHVDDNLSIINSPLVYLGEDDYVKVELRAGKSPYNRTVRAHFKTPEDVDMIALERMIVHLQSAQGVFNA